ncbi:MAG: CAP domain-containing protein [Candidatus Sericytochromatia bacterium]
MAQAFALTVSRLHKVVLSLALLSAAALPSHALDLRQIERQLHVLSNDLRAEKQLAPLQALPELDAVARGHSENMAQQGFFSHSDLQGRSSSDRLALFFPALFAMSSGENIAMRTVGSDDENTVARGLFTQWRNSPGHYANMTDKAFRQLGVGVAINGQKVYATQNFTAALVQLLDPLPLSVSSGPPVTLRFRLLAEFPKETLSLYLKVPDAQARFPVGGGSFYVGGGPLQPRWESDDVFSVTIPTTHGAGTYQLNMGNNGSYYTTPYRFAVKTP